MTIFVISDTHFGHQNIIRLCNRPFANVDEMDAKLVDNWNEVVNEDDTVFHLGDFMWHKQDTGIFNNLKGHKILIKGNHDPLPTLDLGWDSIHPYLELKQFGKLFVLFHYPIEDWNGCFKGSIHLYGHIHDKVLPFIDNRHNVGVEHTGYAPVALESFLK